MVLLRPFLLAILGAFVAAAPMAPVPVKKTGTDTERGHDQKREGVESKGDSDPSASQTIRGARVERASGTEPQSGGAGPHTLPPAERFPNRRPGAVQARPGPFPATVRAAADVRAGLRTLPPPATRDA